MRTPVRIERQSRPALVAVDGGATAKGYKRDAFVDAWARYLPPSPAPDPSHASQVNSDLDLARISDPSHGLPVTDANLAVSARPNGVVTDVTEESTPESGKTRGEPVAHRSEPVPRDGSASRDLPKVPSSTSIEESQRCPREPVR